MEQVTGQARADQDCSARGGRRLDWPPPWLPLMAVLLVVLVWPIIGYGAARAWQNAKNRVEDWLPASFPETKSLIAFFDRFGSDEFLMISWEGCVLDDRRASQLVALLLGPAQDGKIYFAKASSGRDAVDSLVARQRITEAEAKRRLEGLYFGVDGAQSCVIALIAAEALDNRHAAVAWARKASELATGLSLDQIHLAGTTADSIAIDEASAAYLVELNLLSSTLCFFILVLSIRRFWLVGVVFVTALFNQQLALAVIYFSGGHIDSVQLLVANLCFVLSISAALHFLGYLRSALQEDKTTPVLTAMRNAFLPTALAALTTAFGFVSLCTSELLPIRSFGYYAAILVPVNAAIVFAALSVHASWASQRTWRFQWQLDERRAAAVVDDQRRSTNQGHNYWLLAILVAVLSRSPLRIVGIWVFIVAIVGVGCLQLKSSVGTHHMLPADAKLIQDYAWLENRIGPLVPIELVLHFPAEKVADGPETFSRLLALEQMRRRLNDLPQIESTLSVLTFLPPLPTQGGIRNTLNRAAIGKIATESRPQFIDQRLLYENEFEQCWRLSGRVVGSTTENYEEILAQVEAKIDDFHANPEFATIKVEVSGGIPFIYRTQRQLLVDLLSSFSSAFALIAVAMAILFRSLAAGLLLMIPNVTPAAIVFGAMGWLGMEIELGTVLTASVMMGVCVDDTLHLVSHFRELRQKGLQPTEAVQQALHHCGGAMIQTALVCGLGMLLFVFSPFTPVARFAWLTFALLTVGGFSDLLVTPAMLLSPLHHLFYFRQPRLKQSSTSDVSTESLHAP